MRNAGRYIFRCAHDAHFEVTRVFDFIQPTIIALWNLRWQVQGFVLQLPNASSVDLANRFALGSGMRGGELKRACVDTPWERQKSDFAEFILYTMIGAFEEYTARLAELAAPPSQQRRVSKSLQFPGAPSVSPIQQLVSPSSSLAGVFSSSVYSNKRYSSGALHNLLICYRFFKAMRNMLAHNGGIADQETVDAYQRFSSVATIAALGVPEVPMHHSLMLGDEIKLELRGVIGFSDVILRIITTYDAHLSESTLAENEVASRILPVAKKDQFVKAEHKDRRILKMVHNAGLPTATLTPAFVSLLQLKRVIPAFW